jgi:hypothetical protein
MRATYLYSITVTNPNRESREGWKEVSRERAQPRRKNESSQTMEERKFANDGRKKVRKRWKKESSQTKEERKFSKEGTKESVEQ